VSEPNSGPPTPPPDSAVGVLVTTEAETYDAISDNLMAAVLTLWASFSAYWAGDSVVDIAQRIASLVVAAQRNVGRLTEAHLRQQFRRLGVELPRGTIVDLPEALRLGADETEVYQRPIREIRYLESVGTLLDDAVDTATERLESTILTDLQLARVTAAQQVFYAAPEETKAGPITGYRRVIHPELGNVCGLCIAASDRVYRRVEKMSLHPGCKCTLLPIVGGQDPGSRINYEDITNIYAAAGGTTESRALAKVRVAFKENGEIGTILVPEGVTMKGPGTVKRQLSDRAATLRRQQLQRQIDELQSRKGLSQWHQDRLEQLEDLLAAA
jgi:hypothetical protein